MAKGSSKDKGTPAPAGGSSYVNVTFGAAQIEGLSTWLDEIEVGPALIKLVESLDRGLELRLLPRAQGWLAQLTDRERETAKLPCLLSGWGSNPLDATISLAYKHLEMAEQDWTNLGMLNDAAPRWR